MKKQHASAAMLLELIAAVLVFLVSAAVLLGLFYSAKQASVSAGDRQEALTLSESAADAAYALKDPAGALFDLGFTGADGSFTFTAAGYTLVLEFEETARGAGTWRTGTISASAGEETFFTLPVARYFGGGDA